MLCHVFDVLETRLSCQSLQAAITQLIFSLVAIQVSNATWSQESLERDGVSTYYGYIIYMLQVSLKIRLKLFQNEWYICTITRTCEAIRSFIQFD